MDGDILEKIREAVREGSYRFADHAVDELEADALHLVDAESALLTGRLIREQPRGPGAPGPRYTVVGKATDLQTDVGVVCRFSSQQSLLIITAFEIHR